MRRYPQVPKRAKAFSPAGISSFFQICDTEPNGKPITNPKRIGARGGGFALKRGVWTEVEVAESNEKKVEVFINNKLAPETQTTRTVVDMCLEKVDESYSIRIRHSVEVPIGAGFGTSAGGALGTALALNYALNKSLTCSELGRIAHVAEVKCKTGLGTVSGLLFGGCVIVKEPGAPDHGAVDRIPVPPNHYIVAGVFQPRLTREFLESTEKRGVINKIGQETLQKILAQPSVENFMHASRRFAETTGLTTDRVLKLMDEAEKAGAVGAAQNMLGEAVHALVEGDKIKSVLKAFERFLPRTKIVVAEVCPYGVQLTT